MNENLFRLGFVFVVFCLGVFMMWYIPYHSGIPFFEGNDKIDNKKVVAENNCIAQMKSIQNTNNILINKNLNLELDCIKKNDFHDLIFDYCYLIITDGKRPMPNPLSYPDLKVFDIRTLNLSDNNVHANEFDGWKYYLACDKPYLW